MGGVSVKVSLDGKALLSLLAELSVKINAPIVATGTFIGIPLCGHATRRKTFGLLSSWG